MYLSSEIKMRKIDITKEVEQCLTDRSHLIGKFYEDEELMNVGMGEDSGSDSEPEEGCYKDEEIVKMLGLGEETLPQRVKKE